MRPNARDKFQWQQLDERDETHGRTSKEACSSAGKQIFADTVLEVVRAR